MKRMLIAVMVLLLLIAGVQTQRVNAGWTDIWCVGGATNQICINSSGHIVPVTAGSQNLGTVSYPFGILNLQTLTVTTGITAPTATISGAMYQGAIATRSTMPAAGSPSFHGNVTASANLVAGAAISGVTGSLSSTLDVDGNVYLGADGYKSTVTAASGDLAVHNDISAGNDITATGDLAGVNLSASGTGDIDGNVMIGADGYVSTFTAASGDLAVHNDISAGNDITATADMAAVNADFSGTLDADGQSTFGAGGTKSTIPAAGSPFFHGTVTAGTGLTATTGNIAASAGSVTANTSVNGATGDFSGNFDIDGNLLIGADTFVSTFTAATGVFTPHVLGLPENANPWANVTATRGGQVWWNTTLKLVCVSTAAAAYSIAVASDTLVACGN